MRPASHGCLAVGYRISPLPWLRKGPILLVSAYAPSVSNILLQGFPRFSPLANDLRRLWGRYAASTLTGPWGRPEESARCTSVRCIIAWLDIRRDLKHMVKRL